MCVESGRTGRPPGGSAQHLEKLKPRERKVHNYSELGLESSPGHSALILGLEENYPHAGQTMCGTLRAKHDTIRPPIALGINSEIL